jgi:hypothetical protein
MPPTTETIELKNRMCVILSGITKREKRVFAAIETRIAEKNEENKEMQKTKKKMKGVDSKKMYTEVIRLEDIARGMESNIEKTMQQVVELQKEVAQDEHVINFNETVEKAEKESKKLDTDMPETATETATETKSLDTVSGCGSPRE